MTRFPHTCELARVSTVTATNVPQSDGPLTTNHRHELALAVARATPIRKTARVATFNAWATGIIAALSLPFALFSVTGFLMAAGLSLVAYNEFRGRRRLLDFDPSAASLLAWNQIGLLAMIVLYCAWMLFQGLSGDNPFAAAPAANPDLLAAGDLPQWTDDLYRLCLVGFYGTVILLSVIFQGANALYYFTRRKHVARYVAETPQWIREVQRAAS